MFLSSMQYDLINFIIFRKWDGSNFTRKALFDDMEMLKDSAGIRLPNGANPSTHWNTYLQVRAINECSLFYCIKKALLLK